MFKSSLLYVWVTRGPFGRLTKSLCDFGDISLTPHTLVGGAQTTLTARASVRADRRNDPREALRPRGDTQSRPPEALDRCAGVTRPSGRPATRGTPPTSVYTSTAGKGLTDPEGDLFPERHPPADVHDMTAREEASTTRWFAGFGAQTAKRPGIFAELVSRPNESRAIECDLPRTHADHPLLSDLSGRGIQTLRMLLHALHAWRGQYCQGINNVAAHVLITHFEAFELDPHELEDTFWLLAAVTSHFSDLWSPGLPLVQVFL